jgi:hypothetical protein
MLTAAYHTFPHHKSLSVPLLYQKPENMDQESQHAAGNKK